MKIKVNSLLAMGALVSLLSLCPLAQAQIGRGAPSFPGSASTTPGSGQTTGNKGQKREACMKKAGITQSQVEQHKAYAEQTRSKVEAVCSDSALSTAQKKEQIQQIRESARQEEQGVLSQQQISSFESCMGGGAGGAHHGASSDPCAL
jgi:hypothetical protein